MVKRYILAAFVIICVTACMEEIPSNNSQASAGKDVQFAVRMQNSPTRTIYGSENSAGTSVKVNWVEGDMISVYGTDAAQGRDKGTYKITNVFTQNDNSYAGDLQMVGEYGVQWAGVPSSFYAVYPSISGQFTEVEKDGKKGVQASMAIGSIQENYFTCNDGKWTGTSGTSTENQTMRDAIMFACNTGENGAGLESGSTVSLQFKPYSTVLKVILNGVSTESGKSDVYITQVDIVAPDDVKIAGSFPLNVYSDNTAGVGGDITNGTNKVIIKPYSLDAVTNGIVNNICVSNNQTIEFPVFIIPQADMTIAGWKVRVITSNGDRTYTIDEDDTANKASKLEAGQIHKVRVKPLTSLNDDFEFHPEEWIAQLPTDTYISELSLPGAWYSTNPELNDAGVGYQNSYETTDENGKTLRVTNLAEMYRYGIRAFNIDARLSIKPGLDSDDFSNSYEMADYESGDLVLTCAGTESEEVNDYGLFTTPTGKMLALKTVREAILDIGDMISSDENKDEYVVVVISVAEGPKKVSSLQSKIYGTIDAQMMMRATSDLLKQEDILPYLYTGKIGPKTTIKDVQGKIIVKVNINYSDVNTFKDCTAPMTISYATMSTGKTEGLMYYGMDYTTVDSFRYYACQAQETNSSGYSSRKIAIEQVAEIAFNNYVTGQNNNNDDVKVYSWYQLGIGGYSSSNEKKNNAYTEVCDELNTKVSEIITTRINNKTYAPVGIVLMNQVTYSKSTELTANILKLNAKMKLEREN